MITNYLIQIYTWSFVISAILFVYDINDFEDLPINKWAVVFISLIPIINTYYILMWIKDEIEFWYNIIVIKLIIWKVKRKYKI